MSSTAVAIHGASGRMGRRLIALLSEQPGLTLVAAIDRPGQPEIGRDAGTLAGINALGVPITGDWPDSPADVLIDFSSPAATRSILGQCVERGVGIVVGTTGLEAADREALDQASQSIPVFVASNYSKAVNLLFLLTEITARTIGADADIEIVERHHHFKKDAPSGTALTLAEAAATALGGAPLVHGRHGQVGERSRGEIGLHALRTGDNPGEHTVVFGLLGECLELSHRALNRDGFARGALEAAAWLAGRSPGRYGMKDLLNLEAVSDMARCEQGYLCEVCGQDVAEVTDSDLYLRFVLGEVDPELLHLLPERHLTCNPTVAQFIADDRFIPIVATGLFARSELDPSFVAQEVERVTAAYRRLWEIREAGDDRDVTEYPLPGVADKWRGEADRSAIFERFNRT